MIKGARVGYANEHASTQGVETTMIAYVPAVVRDLLGSEWRGASVSQDLSLRKGGFSEIGPVMFSIHQETCSNI